MATVENYPQLLTSTATSSLDPTLTSQHVQTCSSQQYNGIENKLASAHADNWQVTPQFNIYYGGRLEYYRMSADQISASRFPNFHIGDFTTLLKANIIATPRSVHPAKVIKDKLNYAATLRATYNVTRQFGLTADGKDVPRISDERGNWRKNNTNGSPYR